MYVFALIFLSVYVKSGGTLEEASFPIQRDIHILCGMRGDLVQRRKASEEGQHPEENSQCCDVQALPGKPGFTVL